MALKSTFSEMGPMLTQKRIPHRYKRILLIWHDQNRALSAVEAFTLGESDYPELDC